MAPNWVNRLQEVAEERTGLTVQRTDHVALLEASDQERRALQKELDLLGWHVLDSLAGGSPNEVKPEERRKMAKQARMIWEQDPQAGAAVDLLNDFVFGRGVPKPKAADPKVQEILDEVWDDPDNKRVLTSYEAQIALGTDLQLQSNIFILFFDDGEDGKVKLGILPHDLVQNCVQDEDNFLRVTHYVASKREMKWDVENDRLVVKPTIYEGRPVVLYYENLREVVDGEVAADITVPKIKQGEGRVYHVAVNRTSEQVFGVPSMRRLVKWLAAYNDFMAARVDLAQAAAAFIMKRKIKGTPTTVAKLAAKAISRRSDLASSSIDDPQLQPGPRPASVLNENDTIDTQPFSLNTNAGQAMQDAQMIRAQISAATRFPQAYFGDASNSNLATATSLELPVLKAVEARQELFEGIFRQLFDRAIDRAIEKGKLEKQLSEEEIAERDKSKTPDQAAAGQDAATPQPGQQPMALQAASEEMDEGEGKENERDLSYEFSMPNPLKRAIGDLINAIANVARTFDPNNTNLELSKTLLTVALGEGLEMQDPGAVVERIFPDGYEDPMLAQAREQQAQQQQMLQQQNDTGGNFFGPEASVDPNNPYGAPGMSSDYRKNQGQMQEAAYYHQRPVQLAVKSRKEALDELWDEEVGPALRGLIGSGDG